MSLEEKAATCAQQLRTTTDKIKMEMEMREYIAFLNEKYPDIPPIISANWEWQNIWEYLDTRSYGNSFQNLIRFLCHHNLIGNVDPYEVMRGEGYFDNSLYKLRVSLNFI